MRGDERADWISVAEARERILAAVGELPPEMTPLASALGQVLAEDVVSPIDLAPWDNSAMDGFAVRASDVRGASEHRPRLLRVVDDVPAGHFPRRPVEPGTAVKVMTGAPIPTRADSVVRVEHTQGGATVGSEVRVHSDADAERNIRPRGEDLRQGERALARGAVVRPVEVGVAASLGRAELRTIRPPRVAVLASGDELVGVEEFAEVMAGRRIVSSNSYLLAAEIARLGMEARLLGIARDTPESVRAHVETARGCDALVTTAGVSVGEHDHLREVMRALETRIHFWRVRMRPGSAFAFGTVGALGGIPWFGLPGNPVSTAVVFELLVRPALLRMAGHQAIFRPVPRARLQAPCRTRPGLTHFVRARLSPTGEEWSAVPVEKQSSGALSALAAANGLLVVPEERTGWETGDWAPAVLLEGAPLRTDPGY